MPIKKIYDRHKNDGKATSGKNENYTILDSPFHVFGLHEGKVKKLKVNAVYRGKSDSLVKITTRSGREFKVTPIHKLFKFADLKEQKIEADNNFPNGDLWNNLEDKITCFRLHRQENEPKKMFNKDGWETGYELNDGTKIYYSGMTHENSAK